MKTEKEIEKFIDSIKIPSDDEVEAAGVRFDRRIRQIRRRRWIAGGISSAAAVLLCGIVFALVWGKEEDREVVEVAKVAEIDRHVTVPTLVLSDGISLNLKKQETNSRLVGSNIQIAENHITYDTVSKAQEIKYNTLIIPEGFTYDLTLADGTRVTLNAGSRLKYPEEFVGDLREVELGAGHRWCGRSIGDIALSPDTLIVLVRRGKETLVPSGALILEPGDTVVLYSIEADG